MVEERKINYLNSEQNKLENKLFYKMLMLVYAMFTVILFFSFSPAVYTFNKTITAAGPC